MDQWAALEAAASSELGRGSAAVSAAVPGSLRRAAESLCAADPASIVVLTGFAVPDGAGGWLPETDGPLGAAQLADACVRLGWSVRLLTDEPCRAALRAVAPRGVPVDSVHLPRPGRPHACGDLIDEYRRAQVTHVVSIERVGPSADGKPRNMRGEDIPAGTACLEHLAAAGPWQLIAVGDGGNEIGMGAVPAEVVRRVVPLGDRVRCIVPADEVVVAGTSNWGAAALVAGLALQARRPDLVDALLGPRAHDGLVRMAGAGAVDGVTREPALSVDGLDWLTYQSVVEALAGIARAGATAR